MKRLIVLCLLLLFTLLSCDSPVSEVSSDQQQPPTNSEAALTPILPGTPPAQADSIRKAIWRQFKDRHGPEWQIRWSETTGLPVSIFSGLTAKAYPGEARQAARAFLAEYQTLFGFTDLNRLQHVKTRTHRGIRHVTFNQTVKGVPVYEAEYKVHLRPDGRVDMANGTYYPEIEVTTTPSISKSQAKSSAESDLNIVQGIDLQTTSELVIYPDEGKFRLAWKLILFSEQPLEDWFYMVDANSGEILYKLNRLMDVTGDGDVYPTHPGLSSVTNKYLYRLNGNGRLQGTYAYVVNDETSEAYSSTHSFRYSPSNTHFDEANLYYHIDNFRHNFIENLNSGSLSFTQITAHAHATHALYGDVNAWFSPSNREIYFGDASSDPNFNDFAKEDKVVHHEYGHAVIYDIESGIESSSDEEGAISEGTPDYFAGSFTGRSVIGDYVGATRDMANPEISSYSQYESEEPVRAHDGGEFFSAILWNLGNKIGQSTVDLLVYDALYRITADPSFLAFRDAMMAADDGTHTESIQNTFADWGVGTPVPDLEVNITGPNTLNSGETGTWSANVSYNEGSVSYQWYIRYPDGNTWYSYGNGSSMSNYFNNDDTFNKEAGVKVTVTSAGETDTDVMDVVIYGSGGCNSVASGASATTYRPPGC